MSQEVEYQTERLEHLGIVAGVCQEAGIAEWLDKQAGDNRRSVSIGQAKVAMVLNELGFSNRQLYLVPNTLRTSLWSTCWVKGSWRTYSMTIV